MSRLIAAFSGYMREERMRGEWTIKRYVAVLEEFAAFMVSEPGYEVVDLDRVEKLHLVQFLRRGCDGEPSRAVWNIRLAALRSFYDYLFKTELVAANPALKIDRLKTNPKEPVPLSLDEYLALVDAMAASSKRYRARNVAIVQVLFHCALRVAELVSLDIDQVDLENYVFANVRTKGKKWLSAPLNDLVAEAIERYLKERAARSGPAEEGPLFLSNRGKRLGVRAVQDLVTKYARKAGIARTVTPHLLRHSGATELADLGTPLRVVQEICGHASVTTTERYVHVRAGARRRAIEALGTEVARRRVQRRRGRTAQAQLSGESA
jgi:integrase/recombinase XerC